LTSNGCIAQLWEKEKMKTIIILLAASSLLFTGCQTSQSDGSTSAKKTRKEEKQPEVGMTKEQVLALYGKTDNKRMTSEGETWIYNLNMGEMFIPFNFGYRAKTRVVNFDKNGLVASWSYSQ
jgi:outer membrane protein assembly factor BamE (lipoprotein component of BamABCDE complex)